MLDRFAIDFGAVHVLRHLRRGLPVRRAVLVADLDYASRGLAELLHERDRLGAWLDSVPAGTIPPAPASPGTHGSGVSTRDRFTDA